MPSLDEFRRTASELAIARSCRRIQQSDDLHLERTIWVVGWFVGQMCAEGLVDREDATVVLVQTAESRGISTGIAARILREAITAGAAAASRTEV